MTPRDEIAAFFLRYSEAFTRFDADAVNALWVYPALFVSHAFTTSLDQAGFATNTTGLMAFYRRQGMVRADAQVIDTELLFSGVAKARVAYRVIDAADAIIAEWEHVYLLRDAGEGWRVCAALADGEVAAWAERGTPLGQ